MIIVRNLTLPLSAGLPEGEAIMLRVVAERLRIESDRIESIRLMRRSVDARRKSNVHFVATLGVTLRADDFEGEPAVVARLANDDVSLRTQTAGAVTPTLRAAPRVRPIVVGTGPAGLFAALTLAQAGARPLVLERGAPVGDRARAVQSFMRGGVLDTSANIQFGEGGAGTFSDGKLTTNTHDIRCRRVLEGFAEAGAPQEILWQAKPHIGTDRLTSAVERIREQIESMGGEVRFRTQLVDLVIDDANTLRGVVAEGPGGREEIAAEAVVLAAGHSARDTFEMLLQRGADLSQKAFSIGVRVEHGQDLVDRAQYGSVAGHAALGAAEYKLSHRTRGGRSVYTFCMCPGGVVVAAASEEGGVVTNGMSRFARSGDNANSAVLVNVTPADFPDDSPLAGVSFQREWERAAYELGGGSFRAPVQLVGDFRRGVASTGPGDVRPTYPRGVTYADLSRCLPDFALAALREAMPVFDRQLRGFAAADAVMTGVETRSSSPVRIVRDQSLQSNIRGLYPCGEGAGYAGGIMSAAVDGIRCAETILTQYS